MLLIKKQDFLIIIKKKNKLNYHQFTPQCGNLWIVFMSGITRDGFSGNLVQFGTPNLGEKWKNPEKSRKLQKIEILIREIEIYISFAFKILFNWTVYFKFYIFIISSIKINKCINENLIFYNVNEKPSHGTHLVVVEGLARCEEVEGHAGGSFNCR